MHEVRTDSPGTKVVRRPPTVSEVRAMPEINDYRFGHIVIDGEEHTRDVIVLPGRVAGNWWRADGHSLAMDDLADVLDELPSTLVIGFGAHGRMRPERQALDELEARGVRVEVLATDWAVDRYRQLNPATTAAELHLTC